MDNMEKVTWRIWESEGMGKSLLIGGLLFYVPVINLLLLGYFGCWMRQLSLNKGMQLPEWRDGRGILNELGRIIVPFLVWVVVPFVLAGLLVWALLGLLKFMHLDLLAFLLVAYLPVALIAILSPVAFTVSLMRLYRTDVLKDALAIDEILQAVVPRIKRCLFPLIQYYGILLIGLPLIGFAVFLATLPLLAHFVLVMREMDEGLKYHDF
jgi:hypothetical protein